MSTSATVQSTSAIAVVCPVAISQYRTGWAYVTANANLSGGPRVRSRQEMMAIDEQHKITVNATQTQYAPT